MVDSESDQDIFITQNTFSQKEYSPNFELKSDIFSDISEEDSDLELMRITQETEKKIMEKEKIPQPPISEKEKTPQTPSSRFNILTEETIKNFVKNASSSKTFAKSEWAVRLFNKWKNDRNNLGVSEIEKELLTMTDDELNQYLSLFIMEVRNMKGEEYRGNTIYEIITSIQYSLRENGRKINFLDGDNFTELRKVVDAKMKMLAQQGIGIHKRQANIISVEQEEELWQKGILGTDTSQKLLDTLLYSLDLNLALRAGQEHRNLRIGANSQLAILSNGPRKYIQYTEDVSKTNTGGIHHRKIQPKTTCVYQNLENPERCIVNILEKYLKLRPKDGKCTALYLRPLKYTAADDVAVGVNQLTQTVAKLCKEAAFEGFYSNHSLRATAATRLYAAGVDEQLIAQKTGHRSSAVREYKRTNNKQLETVSDLLQPTSKKSKSDIPVNTSECPPNEINIQAGGMSIQMKF